MLLLGIESVVASMLITIVSLVYKVAAAAFELFLVLATGELISTESYKFMINNVYLVLGIIILFMLSFSLLKSMVNPDDQKQGTSVVKKVIINIITSGIIIAVLPVIFTFAYDFQNSFINEYNVIGKFFGYGSLDTNSSNSPTSQKNLEMIRTGAYTIVNGVYTAFFNVNFDNCGENDLVSCQKTIFADSEKDFKADYGDEMSNGKHSLFATINYVEKNGSFNMYNTFSKSIEDEKIDFNFLLSLIGGILLVYVAFSFCFDMAIRMIKLVFYQLIAPIPIAFRVIPEGKLSGTFNQWVKVTLTCYLEVYVRIIIFYFCMFLVNQIIKQDFFNQVNVGHSLVLGLLAKAFVFMGIVTFMKQAPKLISEVTGINSANMKLNIREKLASGGAFTAGAIVGGGLTAGVRNFTNNIDKAKWAESNKLRGMEKFKAQTKLIGGAATSAKTWGSVIAGVGSAGVRSAKAGINAKSENDMKKAAASGANAAINARDKRTAYKAWHDDKIFGFKKDENGKIIGVTGSMVGHITDSIKNIEEYAGLSASTAEVEGYYTKAANTSKAYNDSVEKTYKTKDAYIELDNKVKALKNLKKSGGATSAELAELTRLENSLKQMRIDESMKKVSNIRSAAYRLSYDNKMNYSSDREMIAEFESGLSDGFFDKKGSTAKFIGINAAGEYEFDVTDSKGTTTMTMDSNTYAIYEAMRKGEEFDTNLINESNVIRVQDAIDNVNIHRQNLNTRKADEAFRAQQEKKKQEGK